MKIENLTTEASILEAIKLGEYAFGYQLRIEEIGEKVEKFSQQHLYGIYQEGKLVSKLQILPLEVLINKQKWKMAGIASVASYPEFRRQGHVAQLLTHSLGEMRRLGYTLSYLHPFQIEFYRQYGWEMFCYQKKLTVKKDQLRFIPSDVCRVQRFSLHETPCEVYDLYERYANYQTGMLVRTDLIWKELGKSGQYAVYRSETGRPEGYLRYSIDDRKLAIHEMITISVDAVIGLWNFLCQHDSMIDELAIVTSVFDRLPYLLQAPNVKQELVPWAMARIVDVTLFLRQYPFAERFEPYVVKVSDQLAPWNDGYYIIDGQGEDRFKKVATHEGAVLEMDIRVLTSLLLGSESAIDLYHMKKVIGAFTEIEKCQGSLPILRPFLYDYF